MNYKLIAIATLVFCISSCKKEKYPSFAGSYSCEIMEDHYYFDTLTDSEHFFQTVEIFDANDTFYFDTDFGPGVSLWRIPHASLDANGYYRDDSHLRYDEITINWTQLVYHRGSGDQLGATAVSLTGTRIE